MTEEEKKRIALEIMAQEMNRSPVSHFFDTQSMRAGSIIRKVEKQQAVYASLAKQGITWQELKKVYCEGVDLDKFFTE